MQIKRLRIEEGFFNGLDVKFSEGLNVLIGGRGVGKTSIIELIRFGLGVPNLTNSSSNDSLAHAKSVLKSGQVAIDVECDGKIFTVTRSANEDKPRSEEPFAKPIIFSQTEIESVGLDAEGRLTLIDTFVDSNLDAQKKIQNKSIEVKSITATIAALVKDVAQLAEKSTSLVALKETERLLLKHQQEFAAKNTLIGVTQEKLNTLQKKLSEYAVDRKNIATYKEILIGWQTSFSQDTIPPSVGLGASQKANAELSSLNKELAENNELLKNIIKKTSESLKRVDVIIEILKNESLPMEEEARKYRGEIENHQEGAGSIARELGKTQEDIAHIKNIEKAKFEKQDKLTALYTECGEKVKCIADLRKSIFDDRKLVIKKLNDKLNPSIETDIQHLARLDQYEESINKTLRGSGLQYKEISSTIAKRISPQELLLLTQHNHYEEFADALDLQNDRAARLLGYLREVDLGDILTAKMEDNILFALFDGSEYKNINDLSIGQRCTVALSVVLENEKNVLLIDQPEDHLDNEFVAETLIRAIRQRSDKSQSIISSHNANIPVLGNANRVINLESNGRRGFVRFENKLNTPEIINSIETIMEGGKDAFSKRALFYK